MAHALIHILGSRSGYTTLDATAGLSASDRAELEVLGFGDATSSEAMSRLETEASMVGRRLRSGRFAISRMLPGGTDDKGRPTIEVVSLVLEGRGYQSAAGALPRLAADARFWRLARGAVARGYELPQESPSSSSRDPAVLRAFDTWVAARKVGGVGVLGPQDAAGLLAMVALLDAEDLGDCRWGIGVVSMSAPVDICTLAPSTAAIGSRPVVRAAAFHERLNPEMASVHRHVAESPLLPPRASLSAAASIEPELDRAATLRRYDDEPQPVAPPIGARARHVGDRTLIAAVTATASVALFVFTAVIYARGSRVVNVAVSTGDAAETAPVAPAAPQLAVGGGTGYEGIAVTPPDVGPKSEAVPGPDASAAPVEAVAVGPSNPCPEGERMVTFFCDEDGDGYGNEHVSRGFCAKPSDKSLLDEQGKRYCLRPGDLCPANKELHEQCLFYLDEDNDGLGAGKAEGFCEPASTDAVQDARGSYVRLNGDECPNNPHRDRPGKCGCEYQRKADDCLDDDDGDGVLNNVDTDDDRRVLLDRVIELFSSAARSLREAQQIQAALRPQIQSLRPGASGIPAIAASHSSCMELLQACLVDVYKARTIAVFGEPSHLPRPQDSESRAAANILQIALVEDFKDLFFVLEKFPAASREFMAVDAKLAAEGGRSEKLAERWRRQLLGLIKEREPPPFRESVGKWVCSFIGMDPLDAESEKNRIIGQCKKPSSKKGRDR
jgi:hypothetical protein